MPPMRRPGEPSSSCLAALGIAGCQLSEEVLTKSPSALPDRRSLLLQNLEHGRLANMQFLGDGERTESRCI